MDSMTIFECESPRKGLLFIGDPHVEGRTPGFRRDNFSEAILGKLAWCIEYADQHGLEPILLGDIFDKPRDNPNWLIARLLDLLSHRGVPCIFGNHDCANPHLDENDSLTLLAKSGAVRLLSPQSLWTCQAYGRTVIVGGSPYRYEIPADWADGRQVVWERIGNGEQAADSSLVVWITHHDLVFPNSEEAVITSFKEIPGIQYVINGHIHRRASAEVVRGKTTWVNPGNIARRSRSDALRGHVPAVLRMDISQDNAWCHYVTVPHQDAREVFFDLDAVQEAATENQSSFVSGLAMLQSRRTESGAGLMDFLKRNLDQFEPEVSNEILSLATSVLENEPN